MAVPNPKRDYDHAEPPRGSWGLVLLLVAALAAAVYWQRERSQLPTQSEPTAYDPDRSRGTVSCWTATDCAAIMAASWQAQLPHDLDSSTLESVTAVGGTMTFTRRLKYDRAYHDAAEYPDGKTWEEFEAEFAAVACDEYDHRPLVTLGGQVVHRTLFSDGELLSESAIDSCSPAKN